MGVEQSEEYDSDSDIEDDQDEEDGGNGLDEDTDMTIDKALDSVWGPTRSSVVRTNGHNINV